MIPQTDIIFYFSHKKTKYSFVKKSIKLENKNVNIHDKTKLENNETQEIPSNSLSTSSVLFIRI